MTEREKLEAADADLLWRRLALAGERHALAPCQFLDERRRADDPAGREERILNLLPSRLVLVHAVLYLLPVDGLDHRPVVRVPVHEPVSAPRELAPADGRAEGTPPVLRRMGAHARPPGVQVDVGRDGRHGVKRALYVGIPEPPFPERPRVPVPDVEVLRYVLLQRLHEPAQVVHPPQEPRTLQVEVGFRHRRPLVHELLVGGWPHEQLHASLKLVKCHLIAVEQRHCRAAAHLLGLVFAQDRPVLQSVGCAVPCAFEIDADDIRPALEQLQAFRLLDEEKEVKMVAHHAIRDDGNPREFRSPPYKPDDDVALRLVEHELPVSYPRHHVVAHSSRLNSQLSCHLPYLPPSAFTMGSDPIVKERVLRYAPAPWSMQPNTSLARDVMAFPPFDYRILYHFSCSPPHINLHVLHVLHGCPFSNSNHYLQLSPRCVRSYSVVSLAIDCASAKMLISHILQPISQMFVFITIAINPFSRFPISHFQAPRGSKSRHFVSKIVVLLAIDSPLEKSCFSVRFVQTYSLNSLPPPSRRTPQIQGFQRSGAGVSPCLTFISAAIPPRKGQAQAFRFNLSLRIPFILFPAIIPQPAITANFSSLASVCAMVWGHYSDQCLFMANLENNSGGITYVLDKITFSRLYNFHRSQMCASHGLDIYPATRVFTIS